MAFYPVQSSVQSVQISLPERPDMERAETVGFVATGALGVGLAGGLAGAIMGFAGVAAVTALSVATAGVGLAIIAALVLVLYVSKAPKKNKEYHQAVELRQRVALLEESNKRLQIGLGKQVLDFLFRLNPWGNPKLNGYDEILQRTTMY
jgi:hypothetical protein